MSFISIDQIEERQRQGFVPMEEVNGDATAGFVPVDAIAPEKPSVLRNVALNNPLTAIGETALNLATTSIAMPVAGLAGLATEAGRAVGLTDKTGADVVHAVGDALTYSPRGELGQAATAAVMAPFEKLHEAATWAGNKTQDATGSPDAATAAHTLIEGVLPMAAFPAARAGRAKWQERAAAREIAKATTPDAPLADTAMPEFEFTPIKEVVDAKQSEPPLSRRVESVDSHENPLQQPEKPFVEELRGARDQGLPKVGEEFHGVPGRRGPEAEPGTGAGPVRREQGLRADKRGMDYDGPAERPAATVPFRDRGQSVDDHGSRRPGEIGIERDSALSGEGAQNLRSGETVLAREAFEIETQRPARWALVEADSLKASHDVHMHARPDHPFAKEITRSEQEAAVAAIVRDLDPQRLVDALDDADGAPIVARDGTVETGQRRAIAVQRAYQANGQKAADYRQTLRDQAPRLGLDPAAIDGMRKPVLVRLPDQEAPRRPASADFSNTPNNGELAYSAKSENRTPGEVQKSHFGPDTQAMASDVQNSWAPGQNYVPLRDAMPDTVGQVATKAAKPIRREDVLKPFFEALDINPYWGRVKGNRLGYYMPKKEVLRVKNKSDLEVTAHEVFHAIDDRIPAIRAAWRNDKELREQLKAVSYDKNSVAEGYAEAGRLWLTNPEALEAAAPKVYGWLETFAATHKYGPALRQAQRGMRSWHEQSALDRGRSKIGDPTSLKNRPLLDFIRDRLRHFSKGFRQTVLDDLDGIRLAELDLTGKINPLGAYEMARLSRASHSITDGAIQWGHPVRQANDSFTYAGKGLEEALRPVASRIDDFLTYAVGRSARELLEQGREHLLTSAEVRAMVALETPEFRQAFADLQTWQKGVADFAESLGLLSPETRKLWRRADYVPFWRVEQGMSTRGEVSGAWSGIKALKGGTDNLREPLTNIIMNANTLIGAALKNDARARVVEMIEKEQGGGRFLQRLPPEARAVKVDAQQVQDAVLKGIGIDERAGLSPEGARFAAHLEKQIAEAPEFYQFFVGGQAPKGKNIVAVMKAGKPEYYEVAEPLLLRALTALDRPAQSWIIKLLGFPKRVGQASIVLDPSFIAANYARDQAMAGIMTRSGFRPLIDATDGMRRRMTNAPLYREWVANGGGMSSLFLNESTFRTKLEQFYTRQGIDYQAVIDSPKKLLAMVEVFADAMESGTRIGEFKRATQAGEHPRHAAYRSREVSVDFSQAGDAPAVRALFDTVIFLRAMAVSWDRLYRGVVHDPNRGAIAAKTALLGLASAALYLTNRDDPRYADMPDYLKDSHFHVFLGDHHFMIPRPFEPGAIGRIAEVAVEKAITQDSEGVGKDLWRIIKNTFHLGMTPQFVAPLVEQYANRNSFTGAPIELPGSENLQPFLRSKSGTSETMKAAGMLTRDLPEELQVNPARAEALLKGYLNSWAAYGLLLSDRFVVGDKLPPMRVDEMPVARRFYREEPQKYTRFHTEFYEMLSEAKRLRGTMRELDESGLRQYADEKEKSPLATEASALNYVQKRLSVINREMQAVRRDDMLTPKGKREKLDELTIERNALLKKAVLESKAAQKAKKEVSE